MGKFNCPHCKQPAFSGWDKYLAAKWKMLECPHCQRRVVSQPLILAGFYLLYLADVIDFGFLAYLMDDMRWLLAMVATWIVLDAFSIYLPLAALRDTGGRKQEEVAGGLPERAA